MNYVSTQPLAGGTTAAVNVTSSNTNIGTITTSPATITGGSNSVITQFHPAAGGSTNVFVNTPSGFSTPSNLTSLAVTVGAPALTVTSGVTIGQNLQLKGTVSIGQPAPAGGFDVFLKANNILDPNLPNGGPRRLLISADPNTAGSDELTIHIPAGASSAPIYLQALDGTGTITYTATAPGFNAVTGTINLAPSGIVIAGPQGLGNQTFSVSLSAGGTTPVTVYTALLDPFSYNLVAPQQLAGGLSVTVSLSDSNSSVGSITSPVTITGGTDHSTALFTPQAIGQTTISVSRTPIFVTPGNDTSVIANVTQ